MKPVFQSLPFYVNMNMFPQFILTVKIQLDYKLYKNKINKIKKTMKGEIIMKAFIDRNDCISCELCVETCPEVFQMAADDHAEVYVDEVPSKAEDATLEAQGNCPASVITVK